MLQRAAVVVASTGQGGGRRAADAAWRAGGRAKDEDKERQGRRGRAGRAKATLGIQIAQPKENVNLTWLIREFSQAASARR